MPTTALTIQALGPAIGALVRGVQLSDGVHCAISDTQRDALQAALLQHQVLFFEHQAMEPLAQRALAARFGDLHIHPVYPTVPGVPEIIVLDTSHNNPPDNDNWHTDVTFLAAPAMGAILSARLLPPASWSCPPPRATRCCASCLPTSASLNSPCAGAGRWVTWPFGTTG